MLLLLLLPDAVTVAAPVADATVAHVAFAACVFLLAFFPLLLSYGSSLFLFRLLLLPLFFLGKDSDVASLARSRSPSASSFLAHCCFRQRW